ncbi:SWI/SNF-related matrix-associated actin-dependent regulator of chromatin subfamily A-like protein 1 [Adelges cooleyi]|uniref:SWI/SNF-related matrix-associated actin-dependent regulator of chromatin subfamily A-like protein 1 n=1 Tax=Adelges cooleyi TaxID=133065 RepID=UPI00217F821F|nr:SWI/SNF-related matrix-associated actin-dependent regulator of chromatin subfamily A-like protein 1 [Adelges cooleyi]XP_050420768.1 SWI/SNF-related matrix-associated actin-dependent regulator of chromatin subfamily A-like protein 1 [Adelges cooleyi]XP_050420769.1 SWI/SNF-related matrix-associated actin-dependent regulator of chromatin subfamily A-like protein 1 [Adelges cooleyi]
MSTLSDEQRKMIEEKKKAAQAKLAAKFGQKSSFPSHNITPPKVLNPISRSPQQNRFNRYTPLTVGVVVSPSPSAKAVRINYSLNNEKSKPTSSKPVKGSCELITKDRFVVHVGYHQQLIETFKTIPSKSFDPKTSEWSFLVRDHDMVMNSIKSLEPNVKIEKLPYFILKMCKNDNKSSETDLSKMDLSRINKEMLDNLYPFQKYGIQFGVSKNGRCIIADDMGLGKTIQAIGIAMYYTSNFPLLIVCPSSMRYTWEEEIRTRIPNIPVTSIYVLSKASEYVVDPAVVITSYDLMTKAKDMLLDLKFGIVILDESHSLKNEKSGRTKASLALAMQASRCILLSGTPALSRPMELYTQIKAVTRSAFMTPIEYGKRYCNGQEAKYGWDFSGASNMKELKVVLETQFMVRRLKTEVLKQLPQKVRNVVVLEATNIKARTEDMNTLEGMLNDKSLRKTQVRGALLEYFNHTGDAKLPAICAYITKLLKEDKKFIVFAHHQKVMDGISKVLEDNATYYIRIDGKTSSEERKSVCDQFQNEDKFRVAVLSICAANSGITLTAANLVVFAELFWNPGILTQAEDRAHRIGQAETVTIQYLLAKGTADDHLWPLIQSKLNVLNKAGLSKDNFKDDSTTVINTAARSDQMSILDFFDDDSELNVDDLKELDAIEESQCKRLKRC